MAKESPNKKFWNRYAKLYDYEVLKYSRAAYKEMYRFMSNVLSKDMKVLEIATGTGLIAINIADFAYSIEATDFSPKMIETAKKKNAADNICFSVEDAHSLSFDDDTFDAVIISNALHIMPDARAVLINIKRVLKPNGLLIAPNFTHGHIKDSQWSLNALILKLIGFEVYSKWTVEEYIDFISQGGFSVINRHVLKAAFPLVYLDALNDK